MTIAAHRRNSSIEGAPDVPGASVPTHRAWCAEKRKTGHIARLPESTRAGFAREEQFGELEGFLLELLGAREDHRASGG